MNKDLTGVFFVLFLGAPSLICILVYPWAFLGVFALTVWVLMITLFFVTKIYGVDCDA